MKIQHLALALIFAGTAQLSFAGADCPKYPKSSWLSEFEMQKKIVNEYGFAIKKFLIDDNCYEIYGWEKSADAKDGKRRIEVYFDPKTGDIVKKEVD